MPYYTADDGLRLHYSDSGTGLPLLCLSGLTRNGDDFNHVAPYLSDIRLIRPDYRGRGRSDWADPATYTIAQEARDALALLDHLDLTHAAILGTSRGGLIAMLLGTTARDRLLGVALNDIGPEISVRGLDVIKGYVGRNPVQKTLQEAATARARLWSSFEGVSYARWLAEVCNHYDETTEGLVIRYDPRLREAVLAAGDAPAPFLWPLFDALGGLPLALIRGANSDLLTRATADEMSRRRPDMLREDVVGRGHVPFLDEPQSLSVLHRWLEMLR